MKRKYFMFKPTEKDETFRIFYLVFLAHFSLKYGNKIRPNKHDRVVLIPCKKRLLYNTVQHCTTYVSQCIPEQLQVLYKIIMNLYISLKSAQEYCSIQVDS